MLRLATCKLITRSPRINTSPHGITAKVTKAGKSAMHGANVCSSLSPVAGMKSSLVRNLSGSAISVFTNPIPANPKTEARLAPMRSWMSALPFRSTQPKTPARLRTIKSTRNAFTAIMARSTIMMLRAATAQLNPLRADRIIGKFFVGGNFPSQRCEDLPRCLVAVSFACQFQQPRKDFAVGERAFGRDQRSVEFLQPSFAVGVSAFLFAEVRRRQNHVRELAGFRYARILNHQKRELL